GCRGAGGVPPSARLDAPPEAAPAITAVAAAGPIVTQQPAADRAGGVRVDQEAASPADAAVTALPAFAADGSVRLEHAVADREGDLPADAEPRTQDPASVGIASTAALAAGAGHTSRTAARLVA